MNTKKIFALFAALPLVATIQAQDNSIAAGRLIRMADLGYGDMATYSQYDYSFGTARSAAMGGAFASLGADLSSMNINPAGMGMYRSSEFAFSPSLTWTNSHSAARAGSYINAGDNRFTRFTFGNIGMALNTMQSPSGMVSFTFGFGYNKLADFNYNSCIGLDDQPYSITDVMALQLRGVPVNKIKTGSNMERDLMPNMWGAALAYRAWAVSPTSEGGDLYTSMAPAAPYNLANNYLINNSVGSIGEYDISAGMNFNNRVYLGFTIGIQSIYQKQYSYYEEIFPTINNPDADQGEWIRAYQYDQYARVAGTGVNFKAGIIVRPIDELRIGFAVHTPTFVSLDREYQIVNMSTEPQDISHKIVSVYSAVDQFRYNYTTPTRIMFGASYQIGEIGVIAVDWEHVWYNGMRLGSSDEYEINSATRAAYKQDIKYSFKAADNLRVGVELKPLPMLALRAGYAYYGSLVKTDFGVTPKVGDPLSVLDTPVADRTNSISAGVGFRTGGFSIDAAYVYSKTDYTDYSLFWYDGKDNANVQIPTENIPTSGPVTSSLKRGLATLTLGFRF